MAPRVAVVGAGPLGLMATKTLLEEGFEVTCFEARPYVGGLWNFSDDDGLSVASGTILNSSRFRTAISDYPFPDGTDDFATWRQVSRYLEGYADRFGLRDHIRLSSPVTGLRRDGTGWAVEVTPRDGAAPRRERFDKALVAVGTFHTPKYPKLRGIEGFGGLTVHSMYFNRHEGEFKDKRVLIIGLHASSQDAVIALKRQGARQCYVSHRNGVRMIPRYDANGAAYDLPLTVRVHLFLLFMDKYFPSLENWLIDKALARSSKRAFPDISPSWGLDDPPSIATTYPILGDEIHPLMTSGFCEPCAAVSRITGPKTVELADGRVLDDIDAIVYCTGYDLAAPFVQEEYNPYPVPGAPSNLYRGTFPTHEDPAVRNSLAFLGHGFVSIPGFVQHELIIMAVSQIWKGKSSLPPLGEMQQWHKNWIKWREDMLRRQKSEATFYVGNMPAQDHIEWFDKTAGTDVFSHFGLFNRKAWSFWWQDRSFYNLCAGGVMSPAIWRLFETGKRKAWPGAKEQIYLDNEAAQASIRRKQEMMRLEKDKKT